MAETLTNMAKSVKDRLLNIARQEGRVFDVLLVRFALERLLFRLSVSEHRNRFVLKGGMLVTVWVEDENRVTGDADFLGHGDPDAERLAADFPEIMAIESDDGLVFDLDAHTATAIREEMEYGGTRLKTSAYLEKTRIPVTIDIGFSEAMADATQQLDYPTLLDLPVPKVPAYPPATVIAEEFQAMVALGVLNGRMKDYHDLWAIPHALEIGADDLDAAIAATFERRQTAIPTERPPGLSTEMAMMRSSSANGAPTPHPSNSRTFLLYRSSRKFGNCRSFKRTDPGKSSEWCMISHSAFKNDVGIVDVWDVDTFDNKLRSQRVTVSDRF